jgi:hypothetical protein
MLSDPANGATTAAISGWPDANNLIHLTVTFDTAAAVPPFADQAASDCYNATEQLIGGISFYFGDGSGWQQFAVPAAEVDPDGSGSSEEPANIYVQAPGSYYIFIPGYVDADESAFKVEGQSQQEFREIGDAGWANVVQVQSNDLSPNDFRLTTLNGAACP